MKAVMRSFSSSVRLKRPWLDGYLGPEAMDLNRRIKRALDPDGILNPGAAI